jgi:hypothetical protein
MANQLKLFLILQEKKKKEKFEKKDEKKEEIKTENEIEQLSLIPITDLKNKLINVNEINLFGRILVFPNDIFDETNKKQTILFEQKLNESKEIQIFPVNVLNYAQKISIYNNNPVLINCSIVKKEIVNVKKLVSGFLSYEKKLKKLKRDIKIILLKVNSNEKIFDNFIKKIEDEQPDILILVNF